ncbi:MAG: hypothetical protein KAW56_14675 [Candidatus Marinimicrobia bacterium]|nr:hypothetical protein [Candidatus Neomarinimicrobiota bacterium]
MKKRTGFIVVMFTLFLIVNSCSNKAPRSRLPQPILPDYPDIVKLYWEAWDILNKHVIKGTRENNFAKHYINSKHEGLIHQWSTISTSLFAIYGYNVLPVMESIDNFYCRQRLDGFISRLYLESSGEPAFSTTAKEPMINPPLFTWIELKYFQVTDDSSRLYNIFPILERYFYWIDTYCKGRDEASLLYYTTPFGSGMENLPRGSLEFGGWVDLSAQMALFAHDLSLISKYIGERSKSQYFLQRYNQISKQVQDELWDSDSTFYYDKTREGKHIKVKTIAGFWPLLAKIPFKSDAMKLIAHLKDTTEFKRLHLFPSVAADEQDYNPDGFYWRGGVWGIANYAIVQGLHKYNEYSYAAEVAWNHVANMADIFSKFLPDSSLIDLEFHKYPIHTIWQLYSPEEKTPGTRWDAHKYGEPECIAFSGHGPISMLIEDIIGIEVQAPDDKLTWRSWMLNKHGIKNLRFGDNIVTIWCEKRGKDLLPYIVHGETNSSVKINFIIGDESFSVDFDKGPIELEIMPADFIMRDRTID